jgi:ABC-2 type transport system ATP-binding protein
MFAGFDTDCEDYDGKRNHRREHHHQNCLGGHDVHREQSGSPGGDDCGDDTQSDRHAQFQVHTSLFDRAMKILTILCLSWLALRRAGEQNFGKPFYRKVLQITLIGTGAITIDMATTELGDDRTAEQQSAEDGVISVGGLEKTYGDEEAVTAVDDVSFDIERGTIVGLLGPNGAGKTTTIKSMLGLILPDAGDVSICGVDVYEDPERAHSHVGAMLEGDRNVYWRLTVRENLEFFSGLGGQRPASVRDRHDELLERLDLDEWADTVVNELSKGMKQKVSLASTLARDVEVIFLDEPTLGLDVETSRDLYRELRRLAEEEDITIVLTSHNLDIIEAVSDRVIILNNGQVIADDDTDALVDLFETQTYRVVLDGPVRESVRARLEREFDATCRTDGDRVTVEWVDTDGESVYQMMGVLSETGQELRGVESVDPDLEEAFLRLIDEGGESADTTVAADDATADGITVGHTDDANADRPDGATGSPPAQTVGDRTNGHGNAGDDGGADDTVQPASAVQGSGGEE